MILFGTPNGRIDANDRGMWLTPPFDSWFQYAPTIRWEAADILAPGLVERDAFVPGLEAGEVQGD